jgi:ADP-ribose pyrophosphatase YjhB (NUDIX family)
MPDQYKYAAAIIIENKKILLLQRVKEDLDAGKWTPVNETIEKNESPDAAVIRGVKEEIGTDFTIEKKLNDHFLDGATAVYLGSIKGDIKAAAEEVAGYGWFSYEEARVLSYAFKYDVLIERLHKANLI